MDSIIFDLDGTLWDSTNICIEAWNNTLEKYSEVKNKITADDMKGVMGLVISDVAKIFFPYLEEEKRMEIVKDCCKSECDYLENHGGILYDRLEETLKELSKVYKLFIVSNCHCGYIETFFKFHGLEKYFTDFENPGRTGLVKGENIKLIIKRNNLLNPIYVGDTISDLVAARLAGIPFIYASFGFGLVNEYDYVIEHFAELLDFKIEEKY